MPISPDVHLFAVATNSDLIRILATPKLKSAAVSLALEVLNVIDVNLVIGDCRKYHPVTKAARVR